MQGTEIETKQTTAQAEKIENRGPVMCPRTDVREIEDHYSVEVDLPGVAPSDVDIQIEDDELRVTATRSDSREAEGQNRNYLMRERVIGTYSRAFRLGNQIDRENIEAKLNDGVLRIRLLKHKSALPRRIAVV
jgi:HSP20 family protein